MSNDLIRVVVCGDQGVGKSSLITSLVKDAFVKSIPKVLPPITIPRDFSSPSFEPLSSLATVVVDTSARPSDMATLQKEIRRANVIWLVYSDHFSYERISLYWMMLFRSLGVNLPIVLCANKSDLTPPNEVDYVITEEFITTMKEYKEIESCIRCSAKDHYNVNQAFYLCQRAVTHPISPLYDSKEGALKPAAVSALQRIFFLFDRDQDGILSDSEMLDLQNKCFNKGLDHNDLNEIKSTLFKAGPNLCSEIGITLEGFIQLNKIFAEKGRHETTWGILRTFHYTDSLSLKNEFLYPKINVYPHSSVELSPIGYRFLVDLFILFDKDNDGGLNEDELDNLFKSTPGIPKLWQESNFPQTTVKNEQGFITLQGWLAQWSMTTFLEHKTTLAYLAYLGLERTVDALKVTKPRKIRMRNGKSYRAAVNDRTVFNCFVLGASSSGKSSLLDAFLARPLTETYNPTIKSQMVVNSVEMRGGKQCYLILEEFGELEPAILENQAKLDECDVLCYMYDSSNPESFGHLVELREKYPHLDQAPAIFVASKADLDRQQQRCAIQPDAYTRDLYIPAPLHVSVKWATSLNELFVQITEAAQAPTSCTPGLEPEPETDTMSPIILTSTAVGLMGLMALWIWGNSMQHSL